MKEVTSLNADDDTENDESRHSNEHERREPAAKKAEAFGMLAVERDTPRKPLLELPAPPSVELLEPAEGRRSQTESREAEANRASGYIGHTIFTTETAPATDRKTPNAESGPLSGQRIETMPRDELLVLAEKISVGGDTLRHLYETQLIGERGLRRLIWVHEEGGDIRKALGEEISEREKEFERDPAMRHTMPADNAVTAAPSPDQVLAHLLQSSMPDPVSAAGVVATTAATHTGDEQAAFHKAREAYEQVSEQRDRTRMLIDITFFGLIALLAIVVAIIYIIR